MDRFEDMRAFVQVVESGSLTKAASTLQVATSAVSRRIKDLESRLGTQLIHRTTRQMRLTAPGEAFHTRAVQILQSLEEAEAEAGNQAASLSGSLRIAVPLSFGRSHLMPILIEFANEHPDLVLDVDFSDRIVDLVAEGHDLAIRVGQLADSSLIARKIVDVRCAVAAAPAYWKKHGIPQSTDDLQGSPALCYSGSRRVDTWQFTAPDGTRGTVAVKPAMWATNGEFLADGACAGLGVVLQPSFILHTAVAEGRLQPVLTDHHWSPITVYAVYPQTRHLPARARALIDHLRTSLGPRPDWEAFLATD